QSDGSATKDGDGLAAFRLSPVDARVAGRENVGEEEEFFVGEIAFNLAWSDIRIRHADVLRLSAIVATVKIRVSEQCPAFLILHPAFRAILLRIRVFKRPRQPVWAEKAAATGDGERNDHAIADPQLGHGRPYFVDDA